jgi:hypothetical protein
VINVEITCQVEHSPLDKPRDHSGIRPAAGNSGRATWMLLLLGKQGLAQGVIGAVGIIDVTCIVEAGPWLDHRIDIECAHLAAQAHYIDGRSVDGKIDAETLAATFGQKRLEQRLVIFLGNGFLDEADATLVEQFLVGIARIDNEQAGLVIFEVAFDEGQGTPSDGTETDHHNRTGNFSIYRPFSLRHFFVAPNFDLHQ